MKQEEEEHGEQYGDDFHDMSSFDWNCTDLVCVFFSFVGSG